MPKRERVYKVQKVYKVHKVCKVYQVTGTLETRFLELVNFINGGRVGFTLRE